MTYFSDFIRASFENDDYEPEVVLYRVPEDQQAAAQQRFIDAVKANLRPGYVYVLEVPNSPGLYKIGRTSDPANRLRTFNVKLPFAIKYLCTIQTDDMYQLESDLHQHFADKRSDGEFFLLTQDDIQYIQSLSVH